MHDIIEQDPDNQRTKMKNSRERLKDSSTNEQQQSQNQIKIHKKNLQSQFDKSQICQAKSYELVLNEINLDKIENQYPQEQDFQDLNQNSPIFSDFSQSPLSVSFGAMISRDNTPVKISQNQERLFQTTGENQQQQKLPQQTQKKFNSEKLILGTLKILLVTVILGFIQGFLLKQLFAMFPQAANKTLLQLNLILNFPLKLINIIFSLFISLGLTFPVSTQKNFVRTQK